MLYSRCRFQLRLSTQSAWKCRDRPQARLLRAAAGKVRGWGSYQVKHGNGGAGFRDSMIPRLGCSSTIDVGVSYQPAEIQTAAAQRCLDFVLGTQLDDIPEDVLEHGRYLLLDLLGVAAAGSSTELTAIMIRYAQRMYPTIPGCAAAPILMDGRRVRPAAAALVGSSMIDSVDAHDGHRLSKGHIGVGVLPVALAALAAVDRTEDHVELLISVVLGYEIGTRFGVALHTTSSDYHSSGGFVAMASAAITSRIYGLSREETFEAMGIAEYNAPRSPIMRVVDHTTMLKDGSGWGSMVGVSSAELASEGFTGAPAVTLTAPEVAAVWSDLGTRWHILDQYVKPWPVCRWAHPAIQAVTELYERSPFHPDDIETITIRTFHASTRLATRHPRTADEAQYSIYWPVAAAVYALAENRRLGPADVTLEAIGRREIHGLTDKTVLEVDASMDWSSPGKKQSVVEILLKTGETLSGHVSKAKGDPEYPFTYAEFEDKFDLMLSGSDSAHLADLLKTACLQLGKVNTSVLPSLSSLIYPSSNVSP